MPITYVNRMFSRARVNAYDKFRVDMKKIDMPEIYTIDSPHQKNAIL